MYTAQGIRDSIPLGCGDFPVEMDRRHGSVLGSRAMGKDRQFQNRAVCPSEMAESRFGLQATRLLSLPLLPAMAAQQLQT